MKELVLQTLKFSILGRGEAQNVKLEVQFIDTIFGGGGIRTGEVGSKTLRLFIFERVKHKT